VVQVSAGLYVKGRIDPERSPSGADFSPFVTYGTSKLWNLVATLQLARELDGTGVTVNAVHPGVVRTRLGDMTGVRGALLALVKRFWATPEEGARGPFHLATAAELASVTGRYFDRLRPATIMPIGVLRPGIVARTAALVSAADPGAAHV
jgi:NAD(P)-dependent dehydrogenase (short-subunit alcohol dehydrogenase family)